MNPLDGPEFKLLRRQYFEEEEDEWRASNRPEPPVPLRREADTTDFLRVNSYISKVKALFRDPPSSTPTIRIRPRPVSVGTQTSPIFFCKQPLIKTTTPSKFSISTTKMITISDHPFNSKFMPSTSNTDAPPASTEMRIKRRASDGIGKSPSKCTKFGSTMIITDENQRVVPSRPA